MRLESDLPIVLQPVDSPKRDLEAKVVQAAFNAGAGFSTVIGTKPFVIECQKSSGNAFWVGRLSTNDGRSHGDGALLSSFDARGTALYFHHDEGAFHARKMYRQSIERIHPLEVWQRDCVRSFMTWGEVQRKICAELVPGSAEKTMTTGTPRFDLYGELYDDLDSEAVGRLHQDHGDFIVFCTQFKEFNFGAREIAPFSKRHLDLYRYGFDDSRSSLRALVENWRNCGDKFSGFVHLIFAVADNFPDKTLIIRVHPSEDPLIYRRLAHHLPNVEVMGDGDIRPLLKSARLVIHCESTTGIEAMFCATPTINWGSQGALAEYAILGAEEAGVTVHSIPEALEAVEVALKAPELSLQRQAESLKSVAGLIANVDVPCLPLVRDLLQDHARGGSGSRLDLPHAVWRAKRSAKAVARRLLRVQTGREVSFDNFPISQLLERVRSLKGHSGRIASIGPEHVVIVP